MTFKIRLFFSKPDIEISGGSKIKTGKIVDFPKTILCYDETKRIKHNSTTAQPTISSYRTSTSHKRSIVSDNIVLRSRVDDTVS